MPSNLADRFFSEASRSSSVADDMLGRSGSGLIDAPPSPRESQGGDAFRVEDGSESKVVDRAAVMSTVLLEDPEAETRWYFKFFLGSDHQNYMTNIAVSQSRRELVLLSVLHNSKKDRAKDHSFIRAILWRPTGSQRLLIPTPPKGKHLDARAIILKFGAGQPDKRVEEIRDADLQKELLVLEEQEGAVNFKMGILYAKSGQTTDDEMFSNESASPAFDAFCSLMGDKVELKGWDGFRGGLDVKAGSTGTHSFHTVVFGKELMFHVSTMLPYTPDNPQQLERKRHLGNDICNIIFQEDEATDFYPERIKSQFNHIFALVGVQKATGHYTLKVFTKNTVPEYGPTVPNPAVFQDPNELRHFLLVKLLNAEKAALASPRSTFANKKQRTLAALIDSAFDKYLGARAKKKGSSPNLSRGNSVRFAATGQELKVNKIAAGAAPTSKLGAHDPETSSEQWNPLCVTSSFGDEIICGAQWGKDLLLSTTAGLFRLGVAPHEAGTMQRVLLIHKSVQIFQIFIDTVASLVFLRSATKDNDKGGALYAIPFARFATGLIKKKEMKPYLVHSKGCTLFAVNTAVASTTAALLRATCKVAVACGKKIRTFQYVPASATAAAKSKASGTELIGQFRQLAEYAFPEHVDVLTIGRGAGSSGVLCMGLRSGLFESLELDSGAKAVLHQPEGETRPVYCTEVASRQGDDQKEFLIAYNQVVCFRDAAGRPTRDLECSFTTEPISLAYMPPYLLGVCSDHIEAITLINGKLVKSFALEDIRSLDTSEDLYFANGPVGNQSIYMLSRAAITGQSLGHTHGFEKLPTYKRQSLYGRQLSSSAFFKEQSILASGALQASAPLST